MKIIRGNEELRQHFIEKGKNQVSNSFIEGVTVFHTTIDDPDSNIVKVSNCIFRACNFTTTVELKVLGNIKFDNCVMPRFQGYGGVGSDSKTVSFNKCKVETFYLDRVKANFTFSEIDRANMYKSDRFVGCSINSVHVNDITNYVNTSLKNCDIKRIEFVQVYMSGEHNKEIEMFFSLASKNIDVVCSTVGINSASIEGLNFKNFRFYDTVFNHCRIENCDFSESITARNFFLDLGIGGRDINAWYDLHFNSCNSSNVAFGDAQVVEDEGWESVKVYFNKSGGGAE